MNKVVISITGHRLLTDMQKEKIEPVIKKAIQNIMFTVREHDHTAAFMAVSPLAEGADSLFATAALSLGLPLSVLLPFQEEEYLKDFSSDKVRQDFHQLYEKVPEELRITAGNKHGNTADQLYLDMGTRLVNETDYLIAVWNEKDGNGKGGTADIVTYAFEKQKNILLINPEVDTPYINYLHKDHYKRKNQREIIDVSATSHLLWFIQNKRQEYEANATSYNHAYKRLWATGFITGLVEVCAFSIAVSFHLGHTLHFLMAAVEFLSIVFIILLVIFGNSKKMHSNYVHYRIVSERLRIKQYFAELGLHINHVVVSPIYFSFKEKPEYHILDNTIRLINLSAFSYLPFEAKKEKLQNELILDQQRYHERKKEKFEKKNNQYKGIRQGLFVLFAAAVTFHFCHLTNEFLLQHHIQATSWEPPMFRSHILEEIILFISIFVPATIAACEALKYLYEWETIITLSSAMAGYFRAKSKKLEHVHHEDELEIFLNEINKDMLIENLDWEKYMHDKNEVPT